MTKVSISEFPMCVLLMFREYSDANSTRLRTSGFQNPIPVKVKSKIDHTNRRRIPVRLAEIDSHVNVDLITRPNRSNQVATSVRCHYTVSLKLFRAQ
jgi:hypothetical protein